MSKTLDFSKPLLVLAPLAGYTDLPFRSVVKEFGADLTVSEMISSNALIYNSQKTFKMLEKSPNETPYIIQLAGNDPEVMKRAVEVLNEMDGIDGIDLNCGCPAPKIFNNGAGSNLLGDLPKLVKMLEAIKQTSQKEFTTAKVRLGTDTKIPLDIIKAVQDGGADFVSIHGRTRRGAYKAPVDYDAIAFMKEYSTIPVIANGDITSYQKAQEVLNHTKADGIMIGRAAIGNPWIFYQLRYEQENISNETKKEIILKHYNSMRNFYGEYGAVMFRKHLHTYSKGYQNSSEFRELINATKDPQEVLSLIQNFF
jgi:tRNA-dihydrouridine synthase B